MTTRYTYPYLPTGHIRLLHILSTTPDIRVQFEVTPLDADADADADPNQPNNNLPAYTALSYQWGDETPFGRAIVEPSGQYVDLAQNLTIFFSHVGTLVNNGTRLWIDALCINQQDGEEKSRQVLRMAAVYGRADTVLLWLGAAAGNSDAAMEGIARYGGAAVEAGLLGLEREAVTAWPDVGDDPARVRTRDAVLALMATASGAEGDEGRVAERFPRLAFAALTQREYFNRVWVKQEITLARRAVAACGFKTVDAESFHAAAMFYGMLVVWERNEWVAGRQTRIPGPFSEEQLMTHPDGPWELLKRTMPNPAVGAFFSSRRKYQRGGGRLPLLELLHTSYVRSGALGLQCKDPRDKIYGLLGLASDAGELGIYTDYTLSPDEAFERVARALIGKGHLEVLKWCRSRRVQPPSWVPDFASHITYTWSDDMNVPLFRATGSKTQPTVLDNKGSRRGSIRLQGVRLDTLTATGTIFVHTDSERYNQTAARALFNEVEAFLERPGPSVYLENERSDALWRIPICDREYHPTSMYFRRATADCSGQQFITLRTQSLRLESVMAETMSYQATMQYPDGARCICSEKGYVGLGPRETAPGDIVALLYGATAPFILRAAGNSGNYHLVGEAYVHGVMDGEMMDKGLEEVQFELW